MSIQLTDAAEKHVKRYVAEHDGSVGLRLNVKVAGCSGFTYVVEPATEIASDDNVFEQGDCQVVVSPRAMPFLDGMVIDYVQEGLNKRFSFQNPNVQGACGCGESFTVEPVVEA